MTRVADAYADAAGLLADLAGSSWPEQAACHPDDLPIGETA